MSNEIITKGLGRLAYQFIDSVKLNAFLTAFLEEFQQLSISGLQLLEDRYLANAEGTQLDGIGEIVGLERPTEVVAGAGLFGFVNDPDALGFTDINDLGLGGNWFSYGSSEQPIGDSLYKTLIRAKIIENQTAMVVDDTTELISFMYTAVVEYSLAVNLSPVYLIHKDLSVAEVNLLPTIPIMLGIGDVTYLWTEIATAESILTGIPVLGTPTLGIV